MRKAAQTGGFHLLKKKTNIRISTNATISIASPLSFNDGKHFSNILEIVNATAAKSKKGRATNPKTFVMSSVR